jgi:ABC-2 type transport system ATP-binding protein
MIIETEGLTKKYRTQTAVNNLTLQIREGEVFGFLGPNGAGKTTTLLMFLALRSLARGRSESLDSIRHANRSA